VVGSNHRWIFAFAPLLLISCTGFGNFWEAPSRPTASATLTAFALPAMSLTGSIRRSTITLYAETTNSIPLQAAVFTTNGKKVLVNSVEQVSGVTLNDFTNPVTYTVLAEDGSTQDYLVVVLAPRLVAGLSAWYKADAQAYANGFTITNWTDSSGNGNDLNSSLGGSQPVMHTGIVNGKPVGRFTQGANSGIQRTSVLTGFSGNSITTFIVFRRTSFSAMEQYFFNLGPGGCNGVTQSLQATFGPILAQIPCGPYYVSSSSNLVDTADFHLLTFRYDFAGNFSVQMLDGASQFSGIVGGGPVPIPAPMTKFILGNFDSGSRGLDADLAELLYFSGALSDLEILRMSCYLSEKYALAVGSACP
jgi:hypothetical protein